LGSTAVYTTCSAPPWLALALERLQPPIGLVVKVGVVGRLLLLLDGNLPGRQAALLERCHLLQQSLLETLRHSYSFFSIRAH
jgi:hypothetical protein